MQLLIATLAVISVSFTIILTLKKGSLPRCLFDTYAAWWNTGLTWSRLGPHLRIVPIWQAGGIATTVGMTFAFDTPWGIALAAIFAGIPPVLLTRHGKARKKISQRRFHLHDRAS